MLFVYINFRFDFFAAPFSKSFCFLILFYILFYIYFFGFCFAMFVFSMDNFLSFFCLPYFVWYLLPLLSRLQMMLVFDEISGALKAFSRSRSQKQFPGALQKTEKINSGAQIPRFSIQERYNFYPPCFFF